MAGKANSTRAVGDQTRPNSAAQFEMRGYIIDEDADVALKDVASGLHAIAELCEQRADDVPELSPNQWGGLFRTFSRQVRVIIDEAAFTNRAMAHKRDD